MKVVLNNQKGALLVFGESFFKESESERSPEQSKGSTVGFRRILFLKKVKVKGVLTNQKGVLSVLRGIFSLESDSVLQGRQHYRKA